MLVVSVQLVRDGGGGASDSLGACSSPAPSSPDGEGPCASGGSVGSNAATLTPHTQQPTTLPLGNTESDADRNSSRSDPDDDDGVGSVTSEGDRLHDAASSRGSRVSAASSLPSLSTYRRCAARKIDGQLSPSILFCRHVRPSVVAAYCLLLAADAY